MSFLRFALALFVLPVALAGCKTLGKKEVNVGPCPNAVVLWDAARKVEIKGAERYNNIAWTAEVTGARSLCRYTGAKPIKANLQIDLAFGRGPKAQGQTKDYQYFVSVTRRNLAVIDKQVFPVRVHFNKGQSVVTRTERINTITIPRAKADTSGVNFEIVVGLVLTPQELAFNRAGKHFRINAGK